MALLASWRRSGPYRSAVGSRILPITTYPRRRSFGFLLGAAGVAGFVGLLVASAYLPAWATTLRVGALAWFLGLGALRFALLLRR